MHPDPSEIQKLTERVEALEKQITDWKAESEKHKYDALVFAGPPVVFLLLKFLSR